MFSVLLSTFSSAAPLSGGAECISVRAAGPSGALLPLADPGAPALSPPAPLFARFGEPLHLCLAGPLRAASRYEVKLSFREPDARLRVRLVAAAHAPGGAARAPPGAHGVGKGGDDGNGGGEELAGEAVDDAEKIEFATDPEGRVIVVAAAAGAAGAAPIERVLLRVEATPRGPHRPDVPAASGVWLDARLDELHFGFLPGRARALALVVPLALLCAACAAHGLLHSPYSPLRAAALGARRARDE